MITFVVAAIFVGCLFLLFVIVRMLIERIAKDAGPDLGPGTSVVLSNFALIVAMGAFFSGRWLLDTASNPTQSGEISQDYLGKWRSDANSDIIRTLMSHSVRGCGEFYYKPSTWNNGEYLVYCTRDGETWSAYLVWPNIDRINGPSMPEPSISPPR